ncbi:MAG TPA: hypothetical protein VEK56_00470 [Vicinamibacterales bacterium]|nr:hypothetical protein [Vicinamibacterales bacterium]
MKMFRGTILAAGTAAAFVASSLGAQITARPLVQIERPSRFTIGGGLLVSQPKGELAENIDNGFGGDAYGLFKLDRAGILSLRADLGGAQYGSETLPTTYAYGGRVGFKVETTNSILWAAFGPQLMIPVGRVRPYASAAIGVMDFSTNSSVRGTGQYEGQTFASTENQNDDTHSWIFGGGVYFPFAGRLSMMAIDIGAKYFTGGRATYLREGAIRDNPDGSVTIFPSHSRTDQVTWHVGVAYTIPQNIRR